jgi:hypothetical protein
MANKTVAELTAASTLDGTELAHVVQGGNSRKATVDQINAAGLLDEDDFASDSATKAPSQQSTKAYVDALQPGTKLLASGTLSSQATLDIDLTGYTAFRGIKVILTNITPATDSASLYCRTSTNGGVSYDSGASDYLALLAVFGGSVGTAQGAAAQINLGNTIGNGAGEGATYEVDLLGQTSAVKGKIKFDGITYRADDVAQFNAGGGIRNSAADIDAIRFLFSSGNIASGSYAVYGIA